MSLIITLGFLLCTFYPFTINGQNLPEVSCPNVFKYVRDNNQIKGRINIPSDYTGTYNISVKVSLATLLPKEQSRIGLQLTTSVGELNNGADPQFMVTFPIQTIIPKITEIVFNNRILCTNTEDPLTTAGQTTMTSWYSLTSIPPRPRRPQDSPSRIFPDNESENNTYNTKPVQPPIAVPQTPNVTFLPPAPRPPVQRPPQTQTPPRPVNTPSRPPPISTNINVPAAPSTPTNKPGFGPNPAIRERIGETCGVFLQPLLSQGARINQGEYPWLVAIFQRLALNYKFKCVGNLISDNYVISAGHCFKFENFNFDKDDFSLVMGKQDLTHWPINSEIRSIEKMFIHENYKPYTSDNDIALIKMKTPVSFSALVSPVCISFYDDDSNNMVGSNTVLAGWGSKMKQQYALEAKMTNLKVINNDECSKLDWAVNLLNSDKIFCAKGAGVGPCYGDSGAGLVMEEDGKWTLKGIVAQAYQSDGNLFCENKSYAVFINIGKFSKWLMDKMNV